MRSAPPEELQRGLILAALTAVYFAAGKLGLSLASVNESASAVWPPTGIALAACLILGRRAWPAILAGAFLVNVTTSGSASVSLGIAVGNTLEGMVGARLVGRFAGGRHAFDRTRHFFLFVLLAGMLSTAISATIGVTSLCLGGLAHWAEATGIWLTWWLGDAAGALVVAPALVLWLGSSPPRWRRWQLVEACVLLVAIALVGAVAFGGMLLPPARAYPLAFLCLPLTVWTAFRFGQRETATALLVLSAFAVWGTLRGTGPFPTSTENESLLVLQAFTGVVAVTTLSLGAVVSERRQALAVLERQAAELARSNAELEEFAHVVSHDLKAPLRGIKSIATWIGNDCKEILPDESREHLRLLEQRTKRMSQLIDGVLAYSRVGRVQATPGLIDPMLVIEDVIDLLGLPEGVSVRVEGRLPLVRFDATQLGQIFQNLIGNAVQHLGKPCGEVIVSSRARDGGIEFAVRDDGVGIAERHFERIFKMFQTLDPEGEATGIGLTIVKKIVELHGGSIAVESRLGVGSTFRFWIRDQRQHASPAPSRGPR